MRIKLKEGLFEVIKTETKGLQNCKQCWFGSVSPEPTHCPDNIKCNLGNSRIIFVKVERK